MQARSPNKPLEIFLAEQSDGELEAQVRDYDADIARLQVLRSAAAALLEARRAMNGSTQQETRRRPGVQDAVMLLIQERPEREDWTGDELLSLMEARGWEPGGRTPKNSVDAALSRLVQLGLLARTRRGYYGLPTLAEQMFNRDDDADSTELAAPPAQGAGEG